MNKTILIIEPNVDGHYGVYLKKIVEFFLLRGFSIYLALDDGIETNNFIKNSLGLILGFSEVKVFRSSLLYRPKKYSLIINFWIQMRFWYVCRIIFKKISADSKINLVFLPYLDRLIYSISILGSPFGGTQFSGIVMRPSFHHYEMGIKTPGIMYSRSFSLKYFLYLRVLKLKALQSIFTIDFAFWKFCQTYTSSDWVKVKYFPDPVDPICPLDKDEARKHFGINTNRVALLVYGSIDMRKGIVSALSWALDARSKGINISLLILGEQSEEVRQHLKGSAVAKKLIDDDSLYLLDRYVTTEEEVLAFSAVDLVWLKYHDFYQMSGVMVKAGMLDLPMILPDQGVMGWYKEQLLKSEEHTQYSIPRLKANAKLNPFSEHTWENSLLKLNGLIG